MRGILLVRRGAGLLSSFVEVLELRLAKAFLELLLHICGRKKAPWQARRRGVGEGRRETKRVFERLQTERKLEVELESSVESSQKLQLTNAPQKAETVKSGRADRSVLLVPILTIWSGA